jgi:hypothetical protein
MDEQINGMVETIQQLEKENADLKLRLAAVMQRSEQLVAFVEWLEANSVHSIDRGWIDEYIEATNCV